MEFIEREWLLDERIDYEINIRDRAIIARAAQIQPIHVLIDGIKQLVGWILLKKTRV